MARRTQRDADGHLYLDCECGHRLYFYGSSGEAECECGQTYNCFGQKLLSHREWLAAGGSHICGEVWDEATGPEYPSNDSGYWD